MSRPKPPHLTAEQFQLAVYQWQLHQLQLQVDWWQKQMLMWGAMRPVPAPPVLR